MPFAMNALPCGWAEDFPPLLVTCSFKNASIAPTDSCSRLTDINEPPNPFTTS